MLNPFQVPRGQNQVESAREEDTPYKKEASASHLERLEHASCDKVTTKRSGAESKVGSVQFTQCSVQTPITVCDV